jgi:hypothetical protein
VCVCEKEREKRGYVFCVEWDVVRTDEYIYLYTLHTAYLSCVNPSVLKVSRSALKLAEVWICVECM